MSVNATCKSNLIWSGAGLSPPERSAAGRFNFSTFCQGRTYGTRACEGINFCGTMPGNYIHTYGSVALIAGLNISKSRAIGNNRIFYATSNYRRCFPCFYGSRSILRSASCLRDRNAGNYIPRNETDRCY